MSPNVAKTSKATDTVTSSFEKTHTTLTLALLSLPKLKQNDISRNHTICAESPEVATGSKASVDVTGSLMTNFYQCKCHFVYKSIS
jgi:hypothetical protein